MVEFEDAKDENYGDVGSAHHRLAKLMFLEFAIV